MLWWCFAKSELFFRSIPSNIGEPDQGSVAMKKNIHPNYDEASVTCGCGAKFTTRSTRKTIGVEICSSCHPFFTGKMKFVDTTGRVERFQKKYGKWAGQQPAPTEAN